MCVGGGWGTTALRKFGSEKLTLAVPILFRKYIKNGLGQNSVCHALC